MVDYIATIRRETFNGADCFVARDSDNQWRTYCHAADAPAKGRKLAEWMYHKCEIGSVKVFGSRLNPITCVEIVK